MKTKRTSRQNLTDPDSERLFDWKHSRLQYGPKNDSWVESTSDSLKKLSSTSLVINYIFILSTNPTKRPKPSLNWSCYQVSVSSKHDVPLSHKAPLFQNLLKTHHWPVSGNHGAHNELKCKCNCFFDLHPTMWPKIRNHAQVFSKQQGSSGSPSRDAEATGHTVVSISSDVPSSPSTKHIRPVDCCLYSQVTGNKENSLNVCFIFFMPIVSLKMHHIINTVHPTYFFLYSYHSSCWQARAGPVWFFELDRVIRYKWGHWGHLLMQL